MGWGGEMRCVPPARNKSMRALKQTVVVWPIGSATCLLLTLMIAKGTTSLFMITLFQCGPSKCGFGSHYLASP